ncbi:MAG: hypothetical protein AAB403_16555 [Planctomycetota bacterium]
MNKDIKGIPERILKLAIAALTQANTHAVYMDPGTEHWYTMSVLNAAHAGELFLKAIIAREHPLLIFKDIFSLDDNRSLKLDVADLLKRGRTHEFEKLPQVLWATTGIRLPNRQCYDRLREARNAIQHFCAPEDMHLSNLALEFIYTIVDPLIQKHFGLYAIEHHEDWSAGYDYVVGRLLRAGLRFSMPKDFNVTEIDMAKEIGRAKPDYRKWLLGELKKIKKEKLLN